MNDGTPAGEVMKGSDAMKGCEAVWSLGDATQAGERVELRCAALHGVLQSNGVAGLEDVAFHNTPLGATLLSVETPAGALSPATESYVRGADHVTTHAATEAFPFRTQLYWSGKPLADGAVAATLSISLQTDLLDTRPDLSLHTSVAGATARLWKEDVCRLEAADGVTIIVTAHPTDAEECLLDTSDGACRLRVSPPFLEKGVIRRIRLAAIVLPGQASDEAIAAALADLADDPLPLTT
jgi:hypothetical protein